MTAQHQPTAELIAIIHRAADAYLAQLKASRADKRKDFEIVNIDDASTKTRIGYKVAEMGLTDALHAAYPNGCPRYAWDAVRSEISREPIHPTAETAVRTALNAGHDDWAAGSELWRYINTPAPAEAQPPAAEDPAPVAEDPAPVADAPVQSDITDLQAAVSKALPALAVDGKVLVGGGSLPNGKPYQIVLIRLNATTALLSAVEPGKPG